MTTLKTLHDTETGEVTRIRYKGDEVNLGFDFDDGAAKLDSLATRDVWEDESEAFVELEEVCDAIRTVGRMDQVNQVFGLGTEL